MQQGFLPFGLQERSVLTLVFCQQTHRCYIHKPLLITENDGKKTFLRFLGYTLSVWHASKWNQTSYSTRLATEWSWVLRGGWETYLSSSVCLSWFCSACLLSLTSSNLTRSCSVCETSHVFSNSSTSGFPATWGTWNWKGRISSGSSVWRARSQIQVMFEVSTLLTSREDGRDGWDWEPTPCGPQGQREVTGL